MCTLCVCVCWEWMIKEGPLSSLPREMLPQSLFPAVARPRGRTKRFPADCRLCSLRQVVHLNFLSHGDGTNDTGIDPEVTVQQSDDSFAAEPPAPLCTSPKSRPR